MLYRRDRGLFPFRDANGRFLAEVVGTDATGLLTLRRDDGRSVQYAFKEVEFILQ